MGTSPVTVTIFHNPGCSNSRGALALIREAGIEPTIIEYLKDPPDPATLATLLQRMGLSARELLRPKEGAYAALGLDAAHWTDPQLIEHMVAHPELINRPIVVTPRGVRLCRPSQTVLELLPQRP